MKNCFDILLPVLTKVVNLSLSSGTMPDALKIAELLPVLKKPDADLKSYSNYRPISDLKMVSKVTEKAVAVQLTGNISTHHLDKWFQSTQLASSITLLRLLLSECRMTFFVPLTVTIQ